MSDETVADRRITIERDAVNSNIISGDHNVVRIYNMAWREEDSRLRSKALGPNPYRGMVAFGEEDADRFYGRTKLVGELWAKFRDLNAVQGEEACRFLPILGPSG